MWIAMGWTLVVLLAAATVLGAVLVHRAEKRRRRVCGKVEVLCQRAQSAMPQPAVPAQGRVGPRMRVAASRHN